MTLKGVNLAFTQETPEFIVIFRTFSLCVYCFDRVFLFIMFCLLRIF